MSCDDRWSARRPRSARHDPVDHAVPRPSPTTRRVGRGSSRGFSFVEVLVSIVLIGTVVIATLVSLRATIVASQVGDERSRMVLWLSEGAEAVHRETFEPCSSGVGGVKSFYQAALDGVPVPNGFSGGTLVVDDPEFLSINGSTFVEQWGATCDPDRRAHRLTLRVTNPDGDQTSVLEVIVNG